LWKKQVAASELESTHPTNPYCASSPVTDGKRVYVWHGIAGLFCYDLDGNELWRKDLGKVEHIWGYGSSPMLFEDLLILNFGPGVRSFVVALNKANGEEVWRKEYPQQKSKNQKEYRGSWSTPVLYQDGGRTLLLLSLPQRLFAVDPRTGEEVWNCGGLKDLVYTSPIVAGDAIVAMGGFHSPALGVRRGGKGDVTESHRLWHHESRNPQRVGSGVAVGNYVYIMNEPGNTVCLDAQTGETKWEQRVGKTANNWSSMCYAAGRLYVVNRDGVTFVLEANPQECKILAENEIGRELTRASLAISDGQVFLRTHQNLYCIEAPKK
jgi:outer membrane protein assembly factor BamB